jgi:hypothetical protein
LVIVTPPLSTTTPPPSEGITTIDLDPTTLRHIATVLFLKM